MDENPDYVTRLPCQSPHKSLVVIMHWDAIQDSYVIKWSSSQLGDFAAKTLADSVAAARHLEIR